MGSDAGYRLGVDGGGSGCRARLVDTSGTILAEATGGPANLTTGYDAALEALHRLVADAVQAAGLDERTLADMSAVFGLAGASALGDGERAAAVLPAFRRLSVVSDTEIACAGAHAGRDGGLVVVGTGSQGLARMRGRTVRVGGWGFALSDGGSGAVLGQAALRRALLGLEGIEPASDFTRAVTGRFGDDPVKMLAFALAARPADFAALAPSVFDHDERGDPVAGLLARRAVADVEALVGRLAEVGCGRIALTGGLAPAYRGRVRAPSGVILIDPIEDALAGALRLAVGSGLSHPPPPGSPLGPD